MNTADTHSAASQSELPAAEHPAAASARPTAGASADTAFVVRDQRGCYWGKGREWVDGRDARQVARYRHRDEAVNTLFELSSKDVGLRGAVVEAELNARGEPALAPGCLYPASDAANEADTQADTGVGGRTAARADTEGDGSADAHQRSEPAGQCVVSTPPHPGS